MVKEGCFQNKKMNQIWTMKLFFFSSQTESTDTHMLIWPNFKSYFNSQDKKNLIY